MKDHKIDIVDILRGSLGTFEQRESFAPGMFEPLAPLFRRLGCDSAAIYVADDYPDRVLLTTDFGDAPYPDHIALNRECTFHDAAAREFKDMPGLLLGRLFSHRREIGVLVATHENAGNPSVREAFGILAEAVSTMAYVERVRTNSCRERQERDLFFAQALSTRMMPRDIPSMKNLRLGCEFVRSLEANGDFCDFILEPNGNLLGMVGTCSGTGLRTTMEMTSIMREIYRLLHCTDSLSDILFRINTMLVEEKRRAHQASLCLFHVDVIARKLRVAKSGRMAVFLSDTHKAIKNLSSVGATFLGMVPNPDVHEDVYDFAPGQAFFCVTEGVYSSATTLDVVTHPHWLPEAVKTVLETKRHEPLANAVFDHIRAGNEYTLMDTSALALSVEFTGRSGESLRLKRTSGRLTPMF